MALLAVHIFPQYLVRPQNTEGRKNRGSEWLKAPIQCKGLDFVIIVLERAFVISFLLIL